MMLVPRWVSNERMAFIGCLVVAVLLFWQADNLDMWTIIGPGPGLFPSIAAIFCAALAGTLAFFPRFGDDRTALTTEVQGTEETEPEAPMTGTERRSFLLYCLALVLLIAGSLYLGFIGLSIAVALLLTWWTEGRDWRAALAFGLGCGAVGVIGFNHYLSTSIPLSALDEMLLHLIR